MAIQERIMVALDEAAVAGAEFRRGPESAFPGRGQARWPKDGTADLERKIGQQALEIDFLKACLQRIEQQRMLQASSGNPRSTARSRKRAVARG